MQLLFVFLAYDFAFPLTLLTRTFIEFKEIINALKNEYRR